MVVMMVILKNPKINVLKRKSQCLSNAKKRIKKGELKSILNHYKAVLPNFKLKTKN